MFTIYALTEPKGEQTTWRDVRYIGMSKNVQYRYSQHIACHDTSQEDKNRWVRSLLGRGIVPALHKVETIEIESQAREREQYWIRHAMSQGADLFNRAITYIGDERQKAQEERAIRYAKIQKILESGTYVKRVDRWYPTGIYPAMGGNASTPIRDRIMRVSVEEMINGQFASSQGETRTLKTASDEEFDAFIKKYIPVLDFGNPKWEWEDRIGAINYAKTRGLSPDFGIPKPPVKSRQEVKRMLRVIRLGDEPPDIIA